MRIGERDWWERRWSSVGERERGRTGRECGVRASEGGQGTERVEREKEK